MACEHNKKKCQERKAKEEEERKRKEEEDKAIRDKALEEAQKWQHVVSCQTSFLYVSDIEETERSEEGLDGRCRWSEYWNMVSGIQN